MTYTLDFLFRAQRLEFEDNNVLDHHSDCVTDIVEMDVECKSPLPLPIGGRTEEGLFMSNGSGYMPRFAACIIPQ